MKTIRTFALALPLAALLAAAPSYAETGSVMWEAVYSSSPGYDSDVSRSLVVDAQGNAVVTGYVEHRDGSYNYLTIKYGPYGSTDWIREYDHSWFDVGRAAAADAAGDVFVAGASNNLDNPRDAYSGSYYTDYRVVKYSPAGDVLAEMSASGYGKNNEPSAAAAGSDGAIYVTGTAKNAPDTFPVYYTVKFAPDGGIGWEKLEDFGADSYATGMAVEKDGTLMVAGYYMDVRNQNYDIRVMRYDPYDGRTLREMFYNDRFNNEKAHSAALDKDGNILVTGETDEAGGVTLTVKFSPDGDVLWARQYRGLGARNRGNAVRVDGYGRVYVAGVAVKDEQDADWLLLVYDKDGGLVFEKTYPFGGYSSASGLALDAYGNVVVTGTTRLQGEHDVIRTVRLEGPHPPREGLQVRPDKVFRDGARITLSAQRPLLRKVNLTVRREAGRDGQGYSLFAEPAGLPGDYEYRFFLAGRNSAHHWEKITDYTKKNFIVLYPGPKRDAPLRVMVEVREKGSCLEYEARREVSLQ